MQQRRIEYSGGLSVNRVIVPIIVVLAILHIIIVCLMVCAIDGKISGKEKKWIKQLAR